MGLGDCPAGPAQRQRRWQCARPAPIRPRLVHAIGAADPFDPASSTPSALPTLHPACGGPAGGVPRMRGRRSHRAQPHCRRFRSPDRGAPAAALRCPRPRVAGSGIRPAPPRQDRRPAHSTGAASLPAARPRRCAHAGSRARADATDRGPRARDEVAEPARPDAEAAATPYALAVTIRRAGPVPTGDRCCRTSLAPLLTRWTVPSCPPTRPPGAPYAVVGQVRPASWSSVGGGRCRRWRGPRCAGRRSPPPGRAPARPSGSR
ncbi:hypothetical protein Save01_01938 [Streptomyces avermitilis]